MKKFFLSVIVVVLSVGCNDEKRYSNDKADTREYNTQTNDAAGAKGTVTNDTTSTINNSAYNTDSASGQGSTYDSSRKK